jgi:phosphoribosyl 1,2-cyclic phosphodiesterase
VEFRVLGSSSGGNCTAVWNSRDLLLVDCGFSARYIAHHLHDLGFPLRGVTGVVVTHGHADHITPSAVRRFTELGIPVYTPSPVLSGLVRLDNVFRKARDRGILRPFRDAGEDIGSFEIRSFPVPHDAPGGCVGYDIASGTLFGRRRITMATDVGFVQDHLAGIFRDADAVIIESNHDPAMLEGSGRPEWLKKRIRDIGHLSNQQCASLVLDAARSSTHAPRAVVLAHISQQCNTNDLAVACTVRALEDGGFRGIPVLPTFPSEPNTVVTLA